MSKMGALIAVLGISVFSTAAYGEACGQPTIFKLSNGICMHCNSLKRDKLLWNENCKMMGKSFRLSVDKFSKELSECRADLYNSISTAVESTTTSFHPDSVKMQEVGKSCLEVENEFEAKARAEFYRISDNIQKKGPSAGCPSKKKENALACANLKEVQWVIDEAGKELAGAVRSGNISSRMARPPGKLIRRSCKNPCL